KGFTHLDAGVAPQPVDVALGLTQTLAVLRSKARGGAVKVSIDAAPDLPPVTAVAGELNQVWLNLIDNALDAVGEGGTVQVRAGDADGRVTVRVCDGGPGIPAENVERIFEPFFTTKPVGHGTGLGLDIVRRLVAQQGGEVAVA